ncbi:phosphomevalonate kinase [Serendipita sp. 399]|nr:phosphomevalonate kinase [Serendipita sp. 399]
MTVTSAPGKVLIAGGYLVLDPLYSGVVVAASSRFYTVVEDAKGNTDTIIVKSPQFIEATWQYRVTFDADDKLVLSQVTPEGAPESKNKFVQLALERTFQLVKEIKSAEHVKVAIRNGLEITILGDNDFYSQRAQLEKRNLPKTQESLKKIPPFVPLGVRIENVHKTGMGSSAALITSVVGSLMIHLKALGSLDRAGDDDHARRLIHNAAQYIHCLAQGKVGSGFDVSSAIFGSHIYTRFDPKVIQPLMESATGDTSLLPTISPNNSAWTSRVQSFRLPPLTRLLLADVDAGSDSPSMASKVLKWRKENSEAALEYWTNLDEANMTVSQALLKLAESYQSHPDEYLQALKTIVLRPAVEWHTLTGKNKVVVDLIQQFGKTYHAIEASKSTVVRQKMKRMGELAGVPIEPDEQTRLLDSCVGLPGVIGGGVPGAGGYDAIWLLVIELDDDSVGSPIANVQQLWQSWQEMNVSPLLAEESLSSGLRLEQSALPPFALRSLDITPRIKIVTKMSSLRPTEIEVIELSDSEDECTGDAATIKRLQRNLRNSRVQHRVLKEKNEQLRKEIEELKEKLSAHNTSMAVDDQEPHSEVARMLNQVLLNYSSLEVLQYEIQELIQTGKLAQDHYGKYTREKQRNLQYTKVSNQGLEEFHIFRISSSSTICGEQ